MLFRSSGHPPTTSTKEDHLIVAESLRSPQITSAAVATKMKSKGVSISSTTVQRRLKKAGLSFLPLVNKPLLTEAHWKRRLLWAKENQQREWDQVLFTDECTFKLHHKKNHAWQKRGKRMIGRTVKHPAKVHFWGCVSANGFGQGCTFTKNLNAAGLITIYQHALLPSAKSLFGPHNSTWVLQEDNDPKHKSKLATQWKASHNISTLPWPAQSPDLNCIENVWGVLKANVAARRAKTVKGLRKVIQEEWKKLGREYAAKLVGSMEIRVQEVIAVKGDVIMY